MHQFISRVAVVALATAVAGAAGCAAHQNSAVSRPRAAASPTPGPGVVQAAYSRPAPQPGDTNSLSPKPPVAAPEASLPTSLGLPDLTRLVMERNPRLAQASWAVEAARGQAVQAGLYPNPVVSVTGDELGDRTGPSGIWSAGASQEIVTADKLGLSRAAAMKQVDRASLALAAERYRVLTEVRQNYAELLLLQKRAEVLSDLVKLAGQSLATANKLLGAKEVARLDVVQLEVDAERYQADLNATKRSIPPAFQRLAASVGAPELPLSTVAGDLETPLPNYDLDRTRAYMLSVHPELRSAELGVERAQLLARRAEVDPVPNVTVSSGYTRQGQNDSNDWSVGVSVPVPLWNRNQGNIYAAKAQVGEAAGEVGRVQNDLVGRLSTSVGTYAAARERAERYKAAILPRAEETYQLSLKAYQGGQFEYLRVLQAQRAVGEARLEYLRALGEMWRAASEIAGLTLEDNWPAAPAPQPTKTR